MPNFVYFSATQLDHFYELTETAEQLGVTTFKLTVGEDPVLIEIL